MNPLPNRPAHVAPEHWDRAQRDLQTYRRELPRLLQDGHAGRYAIIREANRTVRVTIEPLDSCERTELIQQEWVDFVHRTAGSITDPSFRRPEQGEYESRVALP